MAEYSYSARSGRYHDRATGRFVPDKDIRDAVDRLADEASARLAALSERMVGGTLSLADWQRESMAILKDAHVAAGVVAHGGTSAMGHEAWGSIGRRLRDEYEHLRTFARQIADGAQPLDGRVAARAQMYGQGARVAFEAIRGRDAAGRGAQRVRNVLGAAEHCDDCRGLAARGWMPLPDMTPLGSRSCLGNDRCRLEYSSLAEVA